MIKSKLFHKSWYYNTPIALHTEYIFIRKVFGYYFFNDPGRCRRKLTWFKHHAIPGSNCANQGCKQQLQWIIPGANKKCDPQGFPQYNTLRRKIQQIG